MKEKSPLTTYDKKQEMHPLFSERIFENQKDL